MSEFSNWQKMELEETSSTNDEIKKLCASAPSGKRFMVVARRQKAGRGRRGRDWVSLEGNLFVSFGLEVAPRFFGQMTFVVGLSLLQAIKELAPRADVCLKWPNDVLVEGGKVSGILLEKADGNYLVVGVGVNIVSAPQSDNLQYSVVSLKDAGIATESKSFLQRFVSAYEHNLSCWESAGFLPIREKWLAHAKNLGADIVVNMEKTQKTGKFLGLDENGVLLLSTPSGIEKIYAGDIFYLKEKEHK